MDIDAIMRESRRMRDQNYLFAGITSTDTRRVKSVLTQMTGNQDNVFVYESAFQMAQNVSSFLNVMCNDVQKQTPSPPGKCYFDDKHT